MPGIQFIRRNPAIDQFNAQVQSGDQARRLEEQDFRQRFQLEQQLGLDRGIRGVFGRAAAAQPMPTVAGAPAITQIQAAPQVPNPAATTPIVSPDQSIAPEDNPDFGGPSRAAPLPNAQPRAGVDVPATVAGPQPVATAAPLSRVQARSGGPGSYRDVMAGLANVPGAGATMMNLYSSERKDRGTASLEERKLHMEGIKLFTDASKNGDVATMRAVSQRYDLGIPPEALNRREIMANIAAGVNTAKSMGITDDQTAIAFGMGYVESIATGADPRAAIQSGLAAAQKAKGAGADFKPKHWFVGPDNTVQAAGEDMSVRSTGAKARPPQPPFNITTAGGEVREQGLRDRAIDNAMKEAGRRWDRMSPDEKQRRIDYHFEFLKSGKPSTPPPSRGGAAAAPNNDPLGLRRK